MKNIKQKLYGFFAAILLLTFVGPAMAANVQLQPGYINGIISIGGIPITGAVIKANSAAAGVGSATAQLTNGNAGTAPFALTVNTPIGGSQDYIVQAGVSLGSPANRGSFTFPPQTVTVRDGQTTLVNFNINPVIVQGNVSVSGVALSRGSIGASYTDAAGHQTSITTPIQSDGSFSFPFPPSSNVRLSGSITTVDNQYVSLTPKVVNIVAGSPLTNINWSVNTTPRPPSSTGTGNISGTMNFSGAPINRMRVRSYIRRNVKAAQVRGRFLPASYTLTTIPGTGGISATILGPSQAGYFTSSLTLPLSSHSNPNITVTANQTSIDNISAEAAFLDGTLTLTGSNLIADLSARTTISAYGNANSLAAGGSSYAQIGQNGAYHLLITPGSWSVVQNPMLAFLNTNPATYLRSTLNILNIDPAKRKGPLVTVAAGQTATSNLNFAVGTATINFSVAGNGTLSSPSISGRAIINDPVTGQLSQMVDVNASGQSTPTTLGRLKFVGVPGLYSLRPSAVVNGARTTFPPVKVRIVAGADAVVDIGAPTLNVVSPLPGSSINGSMITVTGTVTDDTTVSSVVVNGVMAALSSTNNPNDPNEVAFTAMIPAVQGANSIATVASDNVGNAVTDTRSVTVNLNRAPLANAGPDMQLQQTSPTGVSVTLNGAASSDPDGDPLSYKWSGPFGSATGVSPTVNLPAGVSNVNLIVNDGSVDSPSDTAIFTVVDSIAPTFNAQPLNISMEASSANGTVVNYGLPGVSDAADPAPVVSCVPSPGSVFALGNTAVMCTARDASGNSSTNGFTVSVTDTTPPALTVPANITVEANALLSSITLGAATASDMFGAMVSNNAPAAGFPLGTTTVIWTATDGNGLTSTGTQTVTVVDTTAPVLTVPADVSVEANAVLSTVAIGSATATDIFAVTVTSDAPATYALGTTVVTWTATDANGNATSGTQNVTVVDTTAPVLTVPADVTVEANGVLSTVAIGTASATDIFGATVTSDAPATYPVGTTLVTYTAVDGNGLITIGTQNVTVVDTTAPTVTAQLVPVNAGHDDDDEHAKGLFHIVFTASDIADPNPALTAVLNGATVTNGQIVKLEQDDDAETEFEHGQLEVKGMSFTLTATATDASGNVGTAAAAYAFPVKHEAKKDEYKKSDKKGKKSKKHD